MRADEVSSVWIVTLWGRPNHRLFLVSFTSRAVDHTTKSKGKVECTFASGQAETHVGALRVNLPPSNKDAGIENCLPVSSVSVRGGTSN